MKLGPFDVPGYHVGDCRALLAQLPDASITPMAEAVARAIAQQMAIP